MKHFVILILFVCVSFGLKAQQTLPDSLRIAFQQAANDTIKFTASRVVYTFYEETNRDSALHYAQLRYALAKKYNRKIEEAYLQGQIAYQQIFLGRFTEALTNLTEAIQIASVSKDANTWEITPFNTPGKSRQMTLSMLNHMYGHLKMQTKNNESVNFFQKGRRIGLEIGNDFRVTVADMMLASNYLKLNQLDSALVYAKEGEIYATHGGVSKYLAFIWSVMGDIYLQKGVTTQALSYYHKSLELAKAEANFSVVAGAYESLTNHFLSEHNADSTLFYAIKNLTVVKSLGSVTSFALSDLNIGNVYQSIAMAYSLRNNSDSTSKYLQLALEVKDSLIALKLVSLAEFQRLTLDKQLQLQNEEKEQVKAETKRKMYLLLAGIFIAIFIMFLIYRNNRQKQKANALLQEKNKEINTQKEKVEKSLTELKSTQAQLIQSEKMASLGELTAGIAHEIQNPLNFVNNFSELSNELISELKVESLKVESERDKGLEDELLNDIAQNLSKINHHGKRASDIVKGMLEHSRTSTGQKEPTDINALCGDYLRLAYQGLKAKNKDFDAKMETHFDPNLPKIDIIPQDIGRVMLNLINNAFYAVNEHSKDLERAASPSGVGGKGGLGQVHNYIPTVSITTQLTANSQVLIAIIDNGPGIPETIKDKIFQPFFTTKPTGQGTGLGLSLAYDIVTKGHGGILEVESTEGVGSEFIIQLPINNI